MDTYTDVTSLDSRRARAAGELVNLAANGSEDAWSQLVTVHRNLLRSIARGYRLSEEEAGDAMQATWLALITGMGRLRDLERVAGWLASTMRHECLRIVRRRQRERPVDSWLSDAVNTAEDLGVDHELLLAERNALVWRAVHQLSPRQRQLLHALSATPTPAYTEIADRLQMAVGTIGPTRLRALRRLRELLHAQLDAGTFDLTA
jgi:RNA polymerase sigma factor (sigma-70 family)